MPSVIDVAAYILAEKGPMTAMKLQKLVYYSQAWSLVWDERPLFNERIEAWANGPVSPALYEHHRGQFTVMQLTAGNPGLLDDEARKTVQAVLSYYGDKSAQWLSDLTHLEAPWKDARGTLPDGALSSAEISQASMAEYYGSLPPGV
ncbi:type II toxin-antitoxin system antitoxin SocA domain-containing protein [Pararoseomonas sp. SCSIO 73927]|uniref:Panacea domain-containing protein n=1 Tax=Pararoseomonas sp. SCSIO 73927 TaxID=3114537 RepID=UPI0030D1DA7F